MFSPIVIAVGLLAGLPPVAPVAPRASSVGPSVAVFPFRAGSAFSESDATVLSDTLVEYVRRRGTFGRVVSMEELRTIVGLEAQRQLMTQCDDRSCLAEVAAAMGVDMVVTGTLARLGPTVVMNLKLLRTDNGGLVASTNREARGGPEVLTRLLSTAVDDVLGAASMLRPLPVAQPLGQDGVGGAISVGRGVAAAVAAGAVPPVVLALAAAAVGLVSLTIPYIIHVPTPFLTSWEQRRMFFPGVGAGGLTVALVMAALSGTLLTAAVVTAVASAVL